MSDFISVVGWTDNDGNEFHIQTLDHKFGNWEQTLLKFVYAEGCQVIAKISLKTRQVYNWFQDRALPLNRQYKKKHSEAYVELSVMKLKENFHIKKRVNNEP